MTVSTPPFTTPPVRISRRNKIALGAMAFLLKNNWLGPLGEFVMVITTIGRRTGKKYSTPIGYLRDGDTLIALTGADGRANWYRNVMKNPQVTLNVKGKTFRAMTESVPDTERERIFEMYKNMGERVFKPNFGVALDASPEEQAKALAERTFIRFRPLE